MGEIIAKSYEFGQKSWQTPSGLLFATICSQLIYFAIFQGLGVDYNLIPATFGALAICIVLTFLWLVTTNRFFIRGNNDIVFAFVLRTNDSEDLVRIRKILKASLEKLHSGSRPKIKVRLLPPNHLTQDKEIMKYLQNHSQRIDGLLVFSIHGGKKESIYKTQITSIGNYVNPKVVQKSREVFRREINLLPELRMRGFSKDWELLETETYDDALKIEDNFVEYIRHVAALLLIYKGEAEIAIEVLNQIFDPGKIVSGNVDHGEQTAVNHKHQVHRRIGDQIISLSLALARSKVHGEPHKALRILKRLKENFSSHSQMYLQLIMMARLSYDFGEIDNARNFTRNALQIDPGNITAYLNLAFFGILDGDWKVLLENYKIVYEKRRSFNTQHVEIVSFLNEERLKHADKNLMFDFALGVIHSISFERASGFEYLANVRKKLGQSSVQIDVIKFIGVVEQEQLENGQSSHSLKPKKNIKRKLRVKRKKPRKKK